MTPEQEIARDRYTELNADYVDRIRYQVEFAQSVVRTLTLLNGGAVIALFTFVGQVNSRGVLLFDPFQIKAAFAGYIVGLIMAVLALGSGFLAQVMFGYASANDAKFWGALARGVTLPKPGGAHDRIGQGGLIGAAVLALASLAAFAAGSWYALSGIIDAG